MTAESISVLLIDDDATTADLFTRVMEFYNFPLKLVTTGEQGVEYLRNNTPDAVVIDIFLPGMDGYQTFNLIRQARLSPASAFIAITSYYTIDTKTETLTRGFDGYLTKPVDVQQLVGYLQKIVQTKREQVESS